MLLGGVASIFPTRMNLILMPLIFSRTATLTTALTKIALIHGIGNLPEFPPKK
jgi:hypothetical protein